MAAVLSEEGLTGILSKWPRLSLPVLGDIHCTGQLSGLRQGVLEMPPLTCLQPAEMRWRA